MSDPAESIREGHALPQQALPGTVQQNVIIPVPEPFDFQMNLDYLSRSDNECMFHVQNDKLYKLVPYGEKQTEHALMEISAGQGHSLNLRFLGDVPPSDACRLAAVRYVQIWFDLDTDLNPFYRMANRDPLLKETVTRFRGLRLIGIPDLFEALCWGILGQQINLPFAYTLKRRFVEQFGHSVSGGGHELWQFPAPEVIASLDAEQLTRLQITSRKAEYLLGVAALIAEGKLSKPMLQQEPDFAAAVKRLTAIRGIGPWTAHYVCMRCLRVPSAFPIEDVGLHNAIKLMLSMERKPTLDEIRQLAQAWTGWEAYATFYLWRMLY